jgi:hypothetical protein
MAMFSVAVTGDDRLPAITQKSFDDHWKTVAGDAQRGSDQRFRMEGKLTCGIRVDQGLPVMILKHPTFIGNKSAFIKNSGD